jgi:aryl-alcohol dehydrogenase-like predicted oxidoreductase
LHSAKLIHLQEGECIEAMESLRDDGKIRFWGVSLNTFHPEIEGDYLLANGVGNGVQCVLNILNQRAVSFIERARDQGYGVIARMPLQFGLLTGKFTRRTRFPADDHRSVRLTPDVLEEALETLEEVWPIAGSLGMSRTALSLSFAASVPGVTTVIPGIRTSSQVEENVAALRQLSADQVRNLGEIYRRRLHQITSLFEAQG